VRDAPRFPLKVFYDGSCSVCAAEMSVYMRRAHGGRLEFVDITDPAFDPAGYGISLDDFMYQLHAIDREGRVFRGIDAFRAVWLAFPESRRYALLAGLTAAPLVRPVAALAYRVFARLRRYLPKRKAAYCGTGRHPRR